MKTMKGLVFWMMVLFNFAASAYAVDIVEPTVGKVFYPGSKIRVVVKPALGEKLISVGVGFDEIPFDNSVSGFVREFPVPNNANPGELEFKIEALTESKTIVVLTRKIRVVLPPTVKMDGLEIDPALLFLQKLPFGSDPKKERVYGTERIGVAGVYSDGYKRDIASSASGTKYKSGDESIVTVDAEGLAMGQKAGRAKIIITNSGKEVSVDVIVKEK